jgi:hypothetical protein
MLLSVPGVLADHIIERLAGRQTSDQNSVVGIFADHTVERLARRQPQTKYFHSELMTSPIFLL